MVPTSFLVSTILQEDLHHHLHHQVEILSFPEILKVTLQEILSVLQLLLSVPMNQLPSLKLVNTLDLAHLVL
jgi:hypothetical protein